MVIHVKSIGLRATLLGQCMSDCATNTTLLLRNVDEDGLSMASDELNGGGSVR
jgi:hypothetical protein